MRKLSWGANLALILLVSSIVGCGAKPAEKPVVVSTVATTTTPAVGTTANPTTVAQPLPAAVPTGTVPVAAKIDAELQKKISAIGEKLKAQIAKPATDTPVETPVEGSQAVAKVNPPVTPLNTSARQDLSYIPTDAFSAMVLHPRRAMQHSVVKAVRAMLPPDAMDGMFSRGGSPFPGVGPNVGMKELVETASASGIAIENVDEVIFLFDKQLMEVAAAGGAGAVPELPPFGFIVRHSAPIDADVLLSRIPDTKLEVELETHDGVTLLTVPKHKAAIAFITDSMLLVGQTEFVKKMIAAREQTAGTSGLTKRLEAVGNRMYVLAIDGVAIEGPLKKVAAQLPGPIALFAAYITGAKETSLALDLESPEMLQVKLQFKIPTLTAGLFGMIDQQFSEAKKNAPMLRGMMQAEPDSTPLLPYFDQLVADTKLVMADDTISFTVPQLKDFEKLPELLKPAIEKAKRAAEKTRRNNDLKMIGLAMHNYHESYLVFPALNGSGVKDQPHPGLSWRVHLLPYLDEAPLFNQFKLDEPWDSENNQKLIGKMPKIFGTNIDGKTSLHVITGEGTPFKNDAGFTLSAITDGTSNTILALEAGSDVAETWTKPGGLTFDPKEPLKCLGNVQEFGILLMDGSVRRVKNLDPEVFTKLVQHADGLPVMVP